MIEGIECYSFEARLPALYKNCLNEPKYVFKSSNLRWNKNA